jgi:hypothetical protein
MKTRMQNAGLALAAGIVLSAGWVFSRAQMLNTPPKYLLTDKSLVMLSAPQVVAGPVVLDAKWSPDGVRVAAVRRTERPVLDSAIQEMHLVLWSAGRQSHEIWHNEITLESLPHVAWLSSEIVTVEMTWSDKVQTTDANGRVALTPVLRQGVLWVDAARDQVRTIAEMPGDHLYVSPSRPFAVLFSPVQHQMTLLKPDGTPLKQLPLPEKMVWPRFHTADNWSEDGLHVWLDATNGAQTSLKTYALNVQTGQLETDVDPAAYAHKSHPALLRLTRTEQDVKFGHRTQRLHPLWLQSSTGGEQPEVLLAADSSGGALSPTGQAALYLSEQAAWVTPLRIGPKEPFVSNMKAAMQSNAKQLGLAMAMYAQDYDGALPSPDMAIQSAFEPYHKSNNLYDGFNYTFPGGTLPSGDNLGTTELGGIDGPGGRWIIYGDGHVVWKPN